MGNSRWLSDERSVRRLSLALILGITLLGLALDAWGYSPGIMIEDARWQYQQAVDNSFEDWHPPIMAWIWRRLMAVEPGPAPMMVLQLLLYWGGFALAGSWAWRRGRPGLGVALASLGWLPAPMALMGTVLKDSLMSGCLVSATGLILWREVTESQAVRWAQTIGALAAIALAAALRFNAIFACVPLAVAALPARWTRTRMRLAMTSLCAGLALASLLPAINALLDAEKTDVGLSLIIFDLGGITEHSGTSVFPDMGVSDPVRTNHGCYDALMWDSYSTWAKTPCPLGFQRFQSTMEDEEFSPLRLWAGAVAAHPLAYVEHRLAHYNLSTWFLVNKGPGEPGWPDSIENPWGYHVQSNPVLRTLDAVATGASATPLGWPMFWISVALAALIVAISARLPLVVQAVAASSLLFGLGYLVFGVATGMRYHLWTISGAGLAAALVSGRVAGQRAASRTAMWSAAAVITIPCVMTILARLI